VHYLRQCALGGTERQVALLAGEQRRCGHDVQAFAQMASLGEQKTCHAWFAEAAVPLRVAGSAWQSQSQLRGKHLRRSFCFLPGELQDTVHDLLRELLPEPPDVLHCWGDEPNLAGLIAARVAGVPAVVQSTTGMSPHSYPATLQPWMQPWYQAGLREPHVALACISEVGRADYAHWLQTPPDRLSLLRIAVEPKEVPTRSAGQAWRREQGIAADAPVLVGLFRLEPGKRPLLFLEIVAQVKKALPALQVLLIGGGSLESQVRQTIQQLGLHDTVRLLGQPADVLTPLAASDLLLLVSEAEGTPVSVLEAQLTGCVPVITDVGGCRETIAPGLTGLVFPKNDVNGIVTALCHLYTNNTLRQRLADAGPAWVRQHFSLERMTKEAEGIYRDLL
jgi:glycosyltransferase involved in cell wall biosynthesis